MARILIVDDERLNRELIEAYLEGSGNSIVEAETGARALELAAAHPPDLVLLDVMMPGMNGFEVTKLLKAQARDQYLPIILITALSDPGSRVLGLRMGADEFLTKPVERQELLIRVHNLLLLRAREQALLKQNIQHAELHRLKDELASMIVHDIKNPLAAIAANLNYVLEQPSALDHDALEALTDSVTAVNRVLSLAGDLLEVARMEGGRLDLRRTPSSLEEIVSDAVSPRVLSARLRDIKLEFHIDPNLLVEVDRDLITRVVENIVDNGLRFTDAGGRVEVSSRRTGDVELCIGNTGSAIPVELRPRLFDKFAQATGHSGRSLNHGLGLYFCRLAIEAHGGRIWVEETPDLPAVFALALPAA